MPVNLNDWLGDHVWAWWLCLFVLVVTAAVLARSRIVLAAAGGPAAAGGVAAFVPDRFWVQAGVCVVVSVVLVVVVRVVERRNPGAGTPARRAAP
ncbi:hypothetical protein [Granulicoccus sp. GXG6511]|uniref:hypothetical protein n=1 Tax=Granulicoccus sp. GXG6511 TaxID=3381351 RepID=UPI003D7D425B